MSSKLLTNSTANVPSIPQSFDHEAVTGPTHPPSAIGISPAFILGPERPPIPPKLVTQILANKFMELSELLPENLPQCESSSFTIEGGAIEPITKVSSKRKQEISDILIWVECFTSYIMVISCNIFRRTHKLNCFHIFYSLFLTTTTCSSAFPRIPIPPKVIYIPPLFLCASLVSQDTIFPSRALDLLSYMALIIRMAKRYTGTCWLNYDRAFRLEAAASNLHDWSQLKPDLCSYHTSVSSTETCTGFVALSSNRRKPQVSQSASEFCRSCNTGACTSPRELCRIRQHCSRRGCGGPHRRINCREVRERSPQRPQNELRTRRARSK